MKLYKIFRSPPFFLRSSFWIKKKEKSIKSSAKSRFAVIIPLLLFQYGSMRDKIKAIKGPMKKFFIVSLKEMFKSASRLKQNPQIGKNIIQDNFLQELESYAFSLGISKIGYTKVNPDFIFNKFEILYDNAMIVAMEMNRKDMRHNPSDAASMEIWRTYSQLGIIVNKLADFIREKGFNCHPSPAVGGDVMTVPIAQDSGIGVVGKNGLLITPEFGPSLRLAAIFLDIENLPLKTLDDNDHLWVKDFCDICNHCVKTCPGKAIFEQTKILEDGYPQFIDREKCAPAFSKNCSQCISSCPFFHGNYEDIKKSFFTKYTVN